MKPDRIALFAGTVSLALILGALGFQYLAHLPPCEMCHWQRWPHIAAAVVGILGGALIASGRLDSRHAMALALLTILLILVSGGIGAYQAGVEWHWWPGPTSCTGDRVVLTGTLDINGPVVACDVAAWRLFGLSLAGYNALISFAAAALAGGLLARRRR